MKKIAKGIVNARYALMIFFVVAAAVCGWAMTKVNTNYDIISYLPETTDTVQTLAKMEEQFGAVGTAQVMVKIPAEDVSKLKKELEAIEGMQTVVADGSDEATYREGYALFKLFLKDSSFSPEAHDTINSIREVLSEYEIAMNGSAVSSTFLQESIVDDMIIIMIVACIVIAIILLITSTSWIDPLIFAIVVAVSLLINLGTNAILSQVSFITKAICAIMQLALAMDYSIILLHRFNEEKKKTLDVKEAMVNAVSGSFLSVAASSLTTIAGLIALMFMRFTIGLDVGIVLTKGIIISLFSVFLFMPGVIMLFSPVISKTRHKTLHQFVTDKADAVHQKKQQKFDAEAAASGGKPKKAMTYIDFCFKARKIVPLILLVLLVGGAVMNFNVKYTYQLETSKNPKDPVNMENAAIEKIFGKQNSLVVLVPTGNLKKEKELVDFMANYQYDGKHVINGAQGMAALGFGTEIPIAKLREYLSDADVDELIAQIRSSQQARWSDVEKKLKTPLGDETITLYDIVEFLSHAEISGTVWNTEMGYISGWIRRAAEVGINLLDLVEIGTYNAEALAKELTAALAPITTKIEITKETVSAVYLLAGFQPTDAVSVEDFLTAVQEKNLAGNLLPGTIGSLLQKVLDTAVPLLSKMNDVMTPDQYAELLSSDTLKDGLKTLFSAYRLEDASVYELVQMFAGVVPARGSSTVLSSIASGVARCTVVNLILPTVNLAFEMFESDGGMSRLMFNLDMETANDASFAAMKEITEGIKEIYKGQEVYIACETAAYADIKDNFLLDSTTINLISFFAILIIVMLSFRSLGVPVILTVLIQGATWFGMAMQFIAGSSVFFVCYLVVMCIQMGATVDYAILLTNRYIENRYKMNRVDAMKDAFRGSVMTVMTSGSILVIAAFIVGMVSKVAIIADLGVMLSIGCLISLCIILFALPEILLLCDKLIEKTSLKKKGKRFLKDGEVLAAETAGEADATLTELGGNFVSDASENAAIETETVEVARDAEEPQSSETAEDEVTSDNAKKEEGESAE